MCYICPSSNLPIIWYAFGIPGLQKIPKTDHKIEFEILADIIAKNNCNIILKAFLWSIQLARKLYLVLSTFFTYGF